MKRIISLITLIAFLIGNVTYAAELRVNAPQGAIHLAPPLTLDDIADGTPHHKNMSLAMMKLEMYLQKLDEMGSVRLSGASDMAAVRDILRRTGIIMDREDTIFQDANDKITLFFNQVEQVGPANSHIFLMPVSVTRGGKTEHYRLLFSTILDISTKMFPITPCTKDELERLKAEIEKRAAVGRLPARREADRLAMERYRKNNEEIIDPWIAAKMSDAANFTAIQPGTMEMTTFLHRIFDSDYAMWHLDKGPDFLPYESWLSKILAGQRIVFIKVRASEKRPVIIENGKAITVESHTSNNSKYVFLDEDVYEAVMEFLKARNPRNEAERKALEQIGKIMKERVNPKLVHEAGVAADFNWNVMEDGKIISDLDRAYQVLTKAGESAIHEYSDEFVAAMKKVATRLSILKGTAANYTVNLDRNLRTRDYAATSNARPKLSVVQDADAAAAWTARQVIDEVKRNPNTVIGLATGGTMIPVYKEIVRLTQEENVDWSGVVTFNLDEYVGIDTRHPERYRNFMDTNLFGPLLRYGLKIKNTYVPDSQAPDPEKEVLNYVKRIRSAGGVKLWLLGIGSDGHYAFLEPAAVITAEEQRLLKGGRLNGRNADQVLVRSARDFNEFMISEDLEGGYQGVREAVNSILALQFQCRSSLGSYRDLVEKRMEAAKKHGEEITPRRAADELGQLGYRMMHQSEVTFYVALSQEERARLEEEIRKTYPNVTLRHKDDYFGTLAKVVSIAVPTIIDNSRFFDNVNAVPLKALTATGVVRESGRLIQLITGKGKTEALHDTLILPTTPACSSTILKEHPDYTIVADEDAAGALSATTRADFTPSQDDEEMMIFDAEPGKKPAADAARIVPIKGHEYTQGEWSLVMAVLGSLYGEFEQRRKPSEMAVRAFTPYTYMTHYNRKSYYFMWEHAKLTEQQAAKHLAQLLEEGYIEEAVTVRPGEGKLYRLTQKGVSAAQESLRVQKEEFARGEKVKVTVDNFMAALERLANEGEGLAVGAFRRISDQINDTERLQEILDNFPKSWSGQAGRWYKLIYFDIYERHGNSIQLDTGRTQPGKSYWDAMKVIGLSDSLRLASFTRQDYMYSWQERFGGFGISYSQATRDLEQLVEKGILEMDESGKIPHRYRVHIPNAEDLSNISFKVWHRDEHPVFLENVIRYLVLNSNTLRAFRNRASSVKGPMHDEALIGFLSARIAELERSRPRGERGRFAQRRGKSPEAALKIVAWSEDLLKLLHEQGYFTLNDYINAYLFEARAFDLETDISRDTAMRDLYSGENSLYKQGIVDIPNLEEAKGKTATEYRFTLTEDGGVKVARAYLEMLAYTEGRAYEKFRIMASLVLYRLGENPETQIEYLKSKAAGIDVRLKVKACAALLMIGHETEEQKKVLSEIGENLNVIFEIRQEAKAALENPEVIFEIPAQLSPDSYRAPQVRIKAASEILENSQKQRKADGTFAEHPGKSPADALRLIKLYIEEGGEISAPKVLSLYYEHWEELGFERPAGDHASALRTVERDLFESEGSLEKQGILERLVKKGEHGELLFRLTSQRSPLAKFKEIGQRIWLDGLTWEMIASGEFETLVRDHNITGVTTNPTLIKAYLKDKDVLARIAELARQGKTRDEIYYEIIKQLALAVIEVFKRCGVDGKFSVELDPEKADDRRASVEEAMMWTDIAPEYMMVKVAATEAGYRIIEDVIASGRNVNATLIFTDYQYRRVAKAYIQGLQRAREAGFELYKIYSVASFFISRWDVELGNQIPAHLQGRVANAVATYSYNETFRPIFEREEFRALEREGARVQDFLLASTGSKRSKMPAEFQDRYPDDIYVHPVMGSHVVNTLPLETIQGMIQNGVGPHATIVENRESAQETIAEMGTKVDMPAVGEKLFEAGMKSFTADFKAVMATIDEAIAKATIDIPGLDQATSQLLIEAAALIPEAYIENGLDRAALTKELSNIAGRTIHIDENSALIFSEKLAFENGAGIFLPKLAVAGIKVVVIATNDRERSLIDALNEGKPSNQRIAYAGSVAEATTKVKAARFFYFKVETEADANVGGVTTITMIAEKIIRVLGNVCGISDGELLKQMYEAARKFAEAA